MGIFDISIVKELDNKKDDKALLDFFSKNLTKCSDEKITSTNTNSNEILSLEKFKASNSILKYNLTIDIEKTNQKKQLFIEGELQNVWVFVILIILSILLTKGLGILPVILFVYYQKRVNTKFLENLLESFKS